MNDAFLDIYLKILTEQSSPTTFTPEELLFDARNRCFHSKGDYFLYSFEDLQKFCDEKNKPLFSEMVNHLKTNREYAIGIIYFKSIENLDEILHFKGLYHPMQEFKSISMDVVHSQIINFFKNPESTGANFNSIDRCPELGCIIGINGKNVKTNRDFEQVLDHELNHYFEMMNIAYDKANYVEKISTIDKDIIDKIESFYNIDINNSSTFAKDLRTHLFNELEFRSMGANVFHSILRYNESHLNNLKESVFFSDIRTCNYAKYDDEKLQSMILFSWICWKINGSRWIILREGILKALRIKKNIFQKFYIKGKDFIKNLIFSNISL